MNKQNHAINEFYNTQLDYIRDLVTIQEEFINPIVEKKILNDKMINIIFSNLSEILEMERTLCHLLENFKANDHLDIETICKLMVKHHSKYFIYIYYGSHNQLQLSKLKEIGNHKQFKSFLEEKYTSNILKGLDLASYLIKPIQRICKLPLLFKEMKDIDSVNVINQVIFDYQNLINIVNEAARKPNSIIWSIDLDHEYQDLKSEDRVLLRTIDCKLYKSLKRSTKLLVFNDLIYFRDKANFSLSIENIKICDISDSEGDRLSVVLEGDCPLLIQFPNSGVKADFYDVLKKICHVEIEVYPKDLAQKLMTETANIEKPESTRRKSSRSSVLPDAEHSQQTIKMQLENYQMMQAKETINRQESLIKDLNNEAIQKSNYIKQLESQLYDRDNQLSILSSEMEQCTIQIMKEKEKATLLTQQIHLIMDENDTNSKLITTFKNQIEDLKSEN
eukprot:NODE_120_length_17920_cov_0.559782.p1 type:complete len:448 gc:universal NODE_120_length_17920_cov_0.559782:5252-6595(+)